MDAIDCEREALPIYDFADCCNGDCPEYSRQYPVTRKGVTCPECGEPLHYPDPTAERAGEGLSEPGGDRREIDRIATEEADMMLDYIVGSEDECAGEKQP